jgi:hypothetical protein
MREASFSEVIAIFSIGGMKSKVRVGIAGYQWYSATWDDFWSHCALRLHEQAQGIDD